MTQEEIINKSVGRLGSRRLAAALWFEARCCFWIHPDPCVFSLLLLQTVHTAVKTALCSFPQHPLSLSQIQIGSTTSPTRMPEKPHASRPTIGFYLLSNQGHVMNLFLLSHRGKALWLTQKEQVTASSYCH